MPSNDFQKAFDAVPIIGILRGIKKEFLLPTVNAAFDAGLRCVEITMNTADAVDLIAAAAASKRPGTFIGAGTVISGEMCADALAAGARFIVAPVTQDAVITLCKKNGVSVFPGALTPTEVFRAWELGATMVKVFPVSLAGGPKYIKELRGPFDAIPLLACGGVTLENLGDYFKAGASAIAIGASVFRPEWIKAGEFLKIRELTEEYVGAVKAIKKEI